MNKHIHAEPTTSKRYYKDFYGCTASIAEATDGFRLRVANPCGTLITNRLYQTYRGARQAMGSMSDAWQEVTV